MSKHPVIEHQSTEERIRAIAYALWEEEGRPDGRHEEHWLRACEIVAAEAQDPDWLKRQETAPQATSETAAPVEKLARRKVA